MNPGKHQNQVYLEASRVLIHSLKNMGTEADIVVLMLYKDFEAEYLLTRDGAKVIHIEPIEQTRAVSEFDNWFAEIALAKIRAFQLSYERVQLLDSDVALVEGSNLDQLFHYSPQTKLVSEGLGRDSPLRAGWLLLKPSIEDFNGLSAIVHRGKFNFDSGWDNLNLPVKYPDWSSNKIEKWGFYGSELEQGM